MFTDDIKNGESKTIEFKENIIGHSNLIKTLVSFSNRSGGKLVIGISNHGEIIGLTYDEIDEYMEKLPNIIRDSIEPMILPEFYTYTINEKTVLVIEVFSGQSTPYFIKSEGKQEGTYVRIGRTNKQADEEMINGLERKSKNISYDSDINRECDEEDFLVLKDILKENLETEITDDRLYTLGAVKKIGSINYLTNCGAILTGELEHSVIRCGRFIGNSTYEFMDRKTYEGRVFEQIKGATNFIISHLNVAGYFVEGDLRRVDELEIPYEIVRESVINAVLHRDYGMSGADIKISVFNDYIDIVSPGGLAGSITIDEIYKGRSEIRNKVLARILLKANLIEQWGSGIPRIREACRKKGYKLPEIYEEGMFVRLRIYRKSYAEASKLKQVMKENSEVYSVDTSERRFNGYTSASNHQAIVENGAKQSKNNQYEILVLAIRNNSNVTVSEISEQYNIPKSTVQRKLSELKRDGIISRVGAKKNGSWEINK